MKKLIQNTRLWLLLVLMAVPALCKAQSTVWSWTSCSTMPPPGWTLIDSGGNCSWICAGTYMYEDAYSSYGCSGASYDWLISPPIKLDTITSQKINFTLGYSYSGGGCRFYYSTNYKPATKKGNWTLYATYGGSTTQSIDISSLNKDSVCFAWVYTSPGAASGQAAQWNLSNISVTGYPSTKATVTNAGYTGQTSSSAKIGGYMSNNGGKPVTSEGIVWDTIPNPVGHRDSITSTSGYAVGSFLLSESGLPAGKKIYFKAFAWNAKGVAYSPVMSFYTLSTEPGAHTASFTATAISKSAIKLNWKKVSDAAGYILLERPNAAPSRLPIDTVSYTKGQILNAGDSTKVLAYFYSADSLSATSTGLINGSTYYYYLIPFNYDGKNIVTTNYLTSPTIPLAYATTLGHYPEYKSDIAPVKGSEAAGVSSLQKDIAVNVRTDGARIWQLNLRDGGKTLSDLDSLPTIMNQLKLKPGIRNQGNWATYIQSVALFDDSTLTKIATGVVTANDITFSGFELKANDDNYHSFSIRLSLKAVAITDNTILQFSVASADQKAKALVYSSQFGSFSTFSSDSSKNNLQVVATKLRILQQPSNVEAFVAMTPYVSIDGVDIYSNRDLDFTDTVRMYSTLGNVAGKIAKVKAVGGIATFTNLLHSFPGTNIKLIGKSGKLDSVITTLYNVANSVRSDIINDASFVYSQNIDFSKYQGTNPLNTTNSIPVWSLTVRDGGAAGDPDTAATVLKNLTLTITNGGAYIRRAAIYDGTTKLSDTVVVAGNTLYFNNLNFRVKDNSKRNLTLYVSFNTVIPDKSRITFAVNNAVPDPTGLNSLFAVANAGGATSSITGNDNKLDVIGKKIKFVQQPADIAAGSIMYPSPSVKVLDNFGNLDIDGNVITLLPLNAVFSKKADTIVAARQSDAGLAIYRNLIFSNKRTGVRLVAYGSGLINDTSITFNTTDLIWFRSKASGLWTYVNIWESSKDSGKTWSQAIEIPNYRKHSSITITTTDTVTMAGTVQDDITLDETVVQSGAVLVTPVVAGQRAKINDGPGIDLLVQGRLIHNNISVGDMDITAPATVQVSRGGVIDMQSRSGDAASWAGNNQIIFDDSATYRHASTSPVSINNGVFFPNADKNTKPVFQIGANYYYPSVISVTNMPIVINGMLEVESGKTIQFANKSQRIFRNGIFTNGNLILSDSGLTQVTDKAVLGGAGKITLNDSNTRFELAGGSQTDLISNLTLSGNGKASLAVRGTLRVYNNTLSGSGGFRIKDKGYVYTPHAKGMDGNIQVTGTYMAERGSSVEYNGINGQITGKIPGILGNLIINNTAGIVTVSSKITIGSNVNMVKGMLYANSGTYLTLDSSAVVSNYAPARYIASPIAFVVNANTKRKFLPIGSTLQFAPVAISAFNSKVDTVLTACINADPSTSGYSASHKGAGLSAVESKDFYTIKASTATSSKITLYRRSSSSLSTEPVENIRVITWDGKSWNNGGPVARNANADSVSSEQANNFSAYTLGADSACKVPSMPVIAWDTVCIGSGKTLIASSNAQQVRWYDAPSGGKLVGVGNKLKTGILMNDTVYYVEARNIDCISAGRTMVQVTVMPELQAPWSSSINACLGNKAALTADAVDGVIEWYNAPVAGKRIAVGKVFVSDTLNQDTVFYIQAVSHGCTSPRTRVRVNINPIPIAPAILDRVACYNTNVIISSSSNNTLKWYNSATSSASIATGRNYTLTNLKKDTTLYVSAHDGMCESARVPVKAKVLANPVVSLVKTKDSTCNGSAYQIEATGNANIRWYYSASASTPFDTGRKITIKPVTDVRSYYVESYNGACASPRQRFDLKPNPAPQQVYIVVQNTAMQDETVYIEASAKNTDTYFWDFGADANPATAIGAGPFPVSWPTKGTKHITLTATKGNGKNACKVTALNDITIEQNSGITKVDQSLKMRVYPNPANTELYIGLQSPYNMKANLRLLNVLGETVWSTERNISERENVVSTSVASFAAGIYTLTIETEKGLTTQKIIISR